LKVVGMKGSFQRSPIEYRILIRFHEPNSSIII
jgi:hypothetical protein